MAVVRGRRILDLVLRERCSRLLTPAGTRPFESVLAEMEKHGLLPRETVAHARSVKDLANICAHEGTSDEEGLRISLDHLLAVLRWLIADLEKTASRAPSFRACDGIELGTDFSEIDEILRIDAEIYEGLDDASGGNRARSCAWFAQNPRIYTLLYSQEDLIGYCNAMPLEDEAFQLACTGQLHDGKVETDMIRRYEVPGYYRLYICSLGIRQAFRRYPGAFRSIYDTFFEKLFQLAEDEIFVSEICCNAWSRDGDAVARSFGMQTTGKHSQHGTIYHCTMIPPNVHNPVSKMRMLLDKYGQLAGRAL